MATDPIITLERLRADFQEPPVGHDDRLTELILVASNVIEKICRQPIVKRSEAWQFSWRGNAQHTLDHHPVSDLTELRRFGGIAGGWIVIDEDLYCLVQPAGVYTLLYDGGVQNGGLYEATYAVGYDADDIPPIIAQICSEMVQVMYATSPINPEARPLDLASRSTNMSGVGLTETQAFKDQMPRWREALDGFRL